jgi:multidrug efflux pump subunit AcrA (membrane-fusion protein)
MKHVTTAGFSHRVEISVSLRLCGEKYRGILVVAGILVGSALAGCERKAEVVAPPPPEVSVSQPIERTVGSYFETTGRSEATESVDVRARVSGYLLKVNFEDGTEVKRGQELFLIDPRPYEAEVMAAEGNLGRWKAQLRQGESDVARNQRLLPKGATSERELERSIAQRDTAVAEIQATQARLAQAKLDLEFTRVTAPIDGRLSRAEAVNLARELRLGALVAAGEPPSGQACEVLLLEQEEAGESAE